MLVDQARALLSQRKELIAAWLFGSQATGRARPDSDVDLAVLAEHPLTLDQRLSLQTDLEQALQRDCVDVVDLRRGSPILQFEALNGIRLFAHSPAKVAKFSSLVGREYESAMALLQQGFRIRAESLKSS